MPPPDNNEQYPYSFDDQQPPPQQRKRTHQEEDETVGESILDEVDEGFDISGKLLGCGWWLVTLPFRIIWSMIESIFD